MDGPRDAVRPVILTVPQGQPALGERGANGEDCARDDPTADTDGCVVR